MTHRRITHRVYLRYGGPTNGDIQDCFESTARECWNLAQSWLRFHNVRNAMARACNANDMIQHVAIELCRIDIPYYDGIERAPNFNACHVEHLFLTGPAQETHNESAQQGRTSHNN